MSRPQRREDSPTSLVINMGGKVNGSRSVGGAVKVPSKPGRLGDRGRVRGLLQRRPDEIGHFWGGIGIMIRAMKLDLP